MAVPRWLVTGCSSETPAFPARNVLADEPDSSWQTREPSELAWIELAPDPPCSFERVEILNGGTPLVEIFGLRFRTDSEEKGSGRSCINGDSLDISHYDLLLPSQQLMTPGDVSSQTNRSRRMTFSIGKKLLPVAARHKWKRIRIICKQPFNPSENDGGSSKKSIGISFVNFTPCVTTEGIEPESPSSQMVEDTIPNNRVPSFTDDRKRKMDYVPEPSEIKSDRVGDNIPPSKNRKFNDVNTNDSDFRSRTANESQNQMPSGDSNVESKKFKLQNSEENGTTQRVRKEERKTESDARNKESHELGIEKKKMNEELNREDFHSILNGATIAISGIENPERRRLKEQIFEMGGQYSPNWDPEKCTLLISAFYNTPKFVEAARSNNTIVSKQWIYDCYASKKLLPMDNYIMHKGKNWRNVHREKKTPLKDSQNQIPSDDPFSDVENIVKSDFYSYLKFLQLSDEKPDRKLMPSIASEGMLACFDDVIANIKEQKSISDALNEWPVVPQALTKVSDDEKQFLLLNTEKPENFFKNMLEHVTLVRGMYESELQIILKQGVSLVNSLSDSEPNDECFPASSKSMTSIEQGVVKTTSEDERLEEKDPKTN